MLTKELSRENQLTALPLYDAHCHLDMLDGTGLIYPNVVAMITNSTSFASNMNNLGLADGRRIFANLGIDPEYAKTIGTDELDFVTDFIRQNRSSITGIGEIGLDKPDNGDTYAMQKKVFERMLDLSIELHKPVSIHSRNAINEVLEILGEKKHTMAHIHFFEGGPEHARTIQSMGYMISVPPFESSKRRRAIKDIPIDNIMVESDSPAAGATPNDVIASLRIVAESKGISIERAAEATANNTKRFFMLNARNHMIRY